MPFSSSRRGTSWSSSILPSSNPHKSKAPRKGRKRALVKDFIFSNFFAIGLVLSLSLFLLILLRFGVPVDVTTKALYDKIEFLDVDGGAWKQGWSVTYRGNEWDSEKLKVFVVPHSHNDPGWKLTVDEYYDRQSRHILDTIVQTLSKDSRRKFIWEEMSYLERWWRDASDEMKESFINLVKNGQLEIVGGGWVMNDEANSHYFAIIEQIAEGNMWLNDTIGFVPKNSWAIDPFGYSSTMAYLLRRMGFDNMLIQRTHYELKKELAWHKNLEYIWRQSWDAEETTDIFVHMMPFYSYDIPHTCGPEPAICCQFDFARMSGFAYEQCPWGQYPVETTQENVQERALKLLDQYKKKSTLYRTNTLLVPLGDDFRYINVEEAEAQFRNYQMLFDYINSNPNRRLVRDDGRGLGQGVMDNRVMNVVFHLTMEANVSATSNLVPTPFPYSPSLLSHRVGSHLNYPIHAFVSKKPQDMSMKPPPRSFSPLATPLPCDLHIVNFKVPKPLKFLQQPPEGPRFGLILHRRHWDSSYCRKGRSQCTNLADNTVNLFSMFKELTVSKAKATSLNLLHEDPEVMGFSEQFGDLAKEGNVAISPMEIQAYRLELRPQPQ
ncbi:Alpha-mannosidase 2x [Glycine soja]|uniref:Alpha-mannosidase 2x n=1 Tax=Glycine soja TaxID=3848 RepID=A0A0B2RPJ3_GLYSO|nr:Alpha-mannosidase 2x [Glycine soja]